MCIDFTNLNKACPKDSFPLPSIDRLVKMSSDNKFMSFMDTFSRYNHISMAPKEQEKTTFVIKEGFVISEREIEVNPKNIQAILEMPRPKTIKDIQRLIGMVVALNRFVSQMADKWLLLFKVLHTSFSWIEECQIAFGKIKEYLTSPLLLMSPHEGDTLYLYLATSD
ncbi:uncharacterized protein LOC108481419 [Gossypium arboreum]|uniref:uncharacterized protein LOC108481419 n=1 Tax=Gossypium arboreum TaxID=29729 RepID=UPI0008194504|nr:uncharacterized protein LOC108481419 [Gossypium arboreum]